MGTGSGLEDDRACLPRSIIGRSCQCPKNDTRAAARAKPLRTDRARCARIVLVPGGPGFVEGPTTLGRAGSWDPDSGAGITVTPRARGRARRGSEADPPRLFHGAAACRPAEWRRVEGATPRADVIERVKNAEAQIAGLGVRRLALFGSVVRDEARPDSDVDILVEFDPSRKTFDNFLALSESLVLGVLDLATGGLADRGLVDTWVLGHSASVLLLRLRR